MTVKNVTEAQDWAYSVARVMREYADRLDRIAGEAVYSDEDVESVGRFVASMIRSSVEGLAVHAYDFQTCQHCGVPAQWHPFEGEDASHYPQPMV